MFCPYCGTPIDDLTLSACPHCGKDISGDAFSLLRDESESVFPASPPQPQTCDSPFSPPSSSSRPHQEGPSPAGAAAPVPYRKRSAAPFLIAAAVVLVLAAAGILFYFQQQVTPEEQQQRLSEIVVEDYAFLSLKELKELIGPVNTAELPEGVTEGTAYQTICTPPVTFILGEHGVEQVAVELSQPLPYHTFMPMVSLARDSMEEGGWLELTRDAAVISGVSDRISQIVLTFEEPVYSFPDLAGSRITRYRVVLDDQAAGFYHSNPPTLVGHRMDPALVPEDEKIGTDVITGSLRNLSDQDVALAVIFYEWTYWEEGARKNSMLLYAQLDDIPAGTAAPYRIEIPQDYEGFSSVVYGTAGLWY